VLSHGCTCCGPYPIAGKAFCMPGKCRCSNGATPLPAHQQLPTKSDPLKWLADQAAHMVNSNGCTSGSIRKTLRALAIERGFARGAHLEYGQLAKAIEERFGDEVLKWMAAAATAEGRPAAWVSRLLQGSLDGQRRSPAVLFQLVIGTMFESVESFEEAIGVPKLHDVESMSSIQGPSLDFVEPSTVGQVSYYLQKGDMTLEEISKSLGISRCSVIAEVRRQGSRLPLCSRIKKELGEGLIVTLQNELRRGVEKMEICCQHNCSIWDLNLIQLDEPGLYDAHSQAARVRTRNENRCRLHDFLACMPDATRSEVKNEIPGVYEYLVNHDSDWFWLQVPSQRYNPSNFKQRQARDWSSLDQEMALKVSLAFDDMLGIESKPVWATQKAILTRVDFLMKYENNPCRFPTVTSVLAQRVESRAAFIIRRLLWAVTQLRDNDVPISVNRLRRIAALPAQTVRDHRQLVIDLALQLGAEIDGQSFFH